MTDFERAVIDRLARIETKQDRQIETTNKLDERLDKHEARLDAYDAIKNKLIGFAALAGATPGAIWIAFKELTK